MVQTTVAYLAKNESVWNSHPAFVKAFADLKRTLAVILEHDRANAPATNSASAKAHTREQLEDLTHEIAEQLFALSQENGELMLAAATDFSRASLDRMSGEELEHTAMNICRLAEKHLDALADYLVVAADIAELETLTHRHVTGETDMFWTDFGSAQVQDGLRTAGRILRGRLDKLVARYRSTAPDFVAGYHRARLLLDLHGRTQLATVWMNHAAAETVPSS